MSMVMWFNEYSPSVKTSVGGKGASLGEMTGAGLPVPPGFALTTAAFRASKEEAGLDAELAVYLDGLDTNDTSMVSERCSEIRRAIEGMAMSSAVEDDLRSAYATLCSESNTGDVGDAVRRCWASLFTDRATCDRVEMGYEHHTVEMSVVVQKMVRPVSAGVAFTLNPSNGDRSQICIDSAWGFGEGVVSGEVTPDNFLIDKVMFEIGRREISNKTHEFRLTDHDTVEKVETEKERASESSLTDAHIKAIATLAKEAEKHYGCPQDVEWAVDADLHEGENVVLLQSRPETVWSKKQGDSASGGSNGDFMASIVSTLMNPLHAQKR